VRGARDARFPAASGLDDFDGHAGLAGPALCFDRVSRFPLEAASRRGLDFLNHPDGYRIELIER
jgi:hypothetical protein